MSPLGGEESKDFEAQARQMDRWPVLTISLLFNRIPVSDCLICRMLVAMLAGRRRAIIMLTPSVCALITPLGVARMQMSL